MTKPSVILIGAGGHAHACIEVIEQHGQYQIAGLVGMQEEVRTQHLIEMAFGDGIKRLTQSEARNKPVMRKSLVASKTIKAREIFSTKNITTKRPGTGISPMRWDEVVGRTASRDFAEEELIDL